MSGSLRKPLPQKENVPVTLPRLRVRYAAYGMFTLALDGEPLLEAVPRAELGAIITGIVSQLEVPVRVEIHQPDGSTVADIIHPPPETGEPEETNSQTSVGKSLFQARGFLPGEPVLVAIGQRHMQADDRGRLLVNLDAFGPDAQQTGHIVVVGRVSGTISIAGS